MQRTCAAAIAALVLLVAAGCSDDGSAAGTADPTAASTTTTAPAGPDPSPACGSTSPVAPGESEVHLTFQGQDRWYLRHVPPAADGTNPVPLVIDLHGYAEGAALHTKISGLGPYGDTHGFVTVSPQGQGTPAHWLANLDTVDTRLIGAILDEVEHALCIDRDRVYVTGYSNGAFLTSAVACAYSDRIAAVAPVAGMRDVPGCEFERPVPAIAFHGTDDTYVQYQGGMGPGAASLAAPDGSGRTLGELGADSDENASIVPGSMDQAMPDIAAAWATRNGCDGGPEESAAAADVTLIRFGCPEDAEVEVYRVDGGGHTWPGSEMSAALSAVTGRTTMGIDATALMWEFFQAHPLAG